MPEITRLTLHRFRNYATLNVEVPSGCPVILVGGNGIGKTNILEAVSLLNPGRGLRGASLRELDNQAFAEPWAVHATLQQGDEITEIGTGRAPDAENRAEKRIVKINGEQQRGQAILAKLCPQIYVTPQVERCFTEGATERRALLDRLVTMFDSDHDRRLAVYTISTRERRKLLSFNRPDEEWLGVLEERIAAYGVAIAAARIEAIERMQAVLERNETAFPGAIVTPHGEVEGWLGEMPAVQCEQLFRETLRKQRPVDAQKGRTHTGVHRSDFSVTHAAKNQPANLCSTGEQKALLLSIILANSYALSVWFGVAPILLLDEVVAHLDLSRRASLAEAVASTGAQAWLTGTDKALFAAFSGATQLTISDGTLNLC